MLHDDFQLVSVLHLRSLGVQVDILEILSKEFSRFQQGLLTAHECFDNIAEVLMPAGSAMLGYSLLYLFDPCLADIHTTLALVHAAIERF